MKRPDLAQLLALHHTGPNPHPLSPKPRIQYLLGGDGNTHTPAATAQARMDKQYDGEWGEDGAAGPWFKS